MLPFGKSVMLLNSLCLVHEVIANWVFFFCLYIWYSLRVGGKSATHDLKLAAESCLLLISSVLNEIKKKTFPPQTFLNINVPTDVSNHKVISQIRKVIGGDITNISFSDSFDSKICSNASLVASLVGIF